MEIFLGFVRNVDRHNNPPHSQHNVMLENHVTTSPSDSLTLADTLGPVREQTTFSAPSRPSTSKHSLVQNNEHRASSPSLPGRLADSPLSIREQTPFRVPTRLPIQFRALPCPSTIQGGLISVRHNTPHPQTVASTSTKWVIQ